MTLQALPLRGELRLAELAVTFLPLGAASQASPKETKQEGEAEENLAAAAATTCQLRVTQAPRNEARHPLNLARGVRQRPAPAAAAREQSPTSTPKSGAGQMQETALVSAAMEEHPARGRLAREAAPPGRHPMRPAHQTRPRRPNSARLAAWASSVAVAARPLPTPNVAAARENPKKGCQLLQDAGRVVSEKAKRPH